MSLKRVSEIDFDDLRKEWKRGESIFWSRHWEQRGYKSWEEFRQARISLYKMPERDWSIYWMSDPGVDAGSMHCDASTRWTDFYTDRAASNFGTLKTHPFFQNHERILDMRNQFLADQFLCGMRDRETHQVIVVDGHHRALALAGIEDNISPPVHIALADLDPNEFRWYMHGGNLLKLARITHEPLGRIRQITADLVSGLVKK